MEPQHRPDATEALTAILAERIVVLDGAMGTAIQRDRPDEAGYRGERFADHPGDLVGNNDLLTITQPRIIRTIHEEYLAAGSDVIETNLKGPFLMSQHAAREMSETGGGVILHNASIDASGADVLLTARAECFLYGHPDPQREAVVRLQAFADAGADVLYAPGVRSRDDIASLVDAVAPHPINVLMASDTGLTVKDLAEMGVRRVSVGSAMARVAWAAFLSAARAIADEGSFAGLSRAASFDDLNRLFSTS